MHFGTATGKTASLLCVAVVALSGCGSSSDDRADRSLPDQPDACAVLSVDEISSLIGNEVRPGADTSGGQGCSYVGVAGGRSLLINLQTGDSEKQFALASALMQKQTSEFLDVRGMGDGAFVYAARDSTVSGGQARVGSTRVHTIVRGGETSDLGVASRILGVAVRSLMPHPVDAGS